MNSKEIMEKMLAQNRMSRSYDENKNFNMDNLSKENVNNKYQHL